MEMEEKLDTLPGVSVTAVVPLVKGKAEKLPVEPLSVSSMHTL